jgi:hypothetical protein
MIAVVAVAGTAAIVFWFVSSCHFRRCWWAGGRTGSFNISGGGCSVGLPVLQFVASTLLLVPYVPVHNIWEKYVVVSSFEESFTVTGRLPLYR